MSLSNDIISQFVELTKTSDKIQNEASVYGTIVTDGENTYVKLDGSEQLTPIETTTNVSGGERVIVRIKDHKATVTGNITSPSVNNGQLEDVKDQITEFEVVIAERVTANEIVVGKIEADNVIINKKLTAIEGEFETIKADNITINEKLTANEAAIADLDAKKLSAETADLKYATIGGLNATNAEINDLKANHAEFSDATIKRLEADEASIKKLDTEKLSAKDADIKYANIDFANISMAAVEKLFAESGIIKDLVVGDTSITGELVGVTIKGDLIEANTLVADKLVIKGSDGLYYKLNTDGMTTEAEQTEYNSLNGSIITAKSITASKINVKDLVAFGATIGGFKINQNAIYSGAKESVNNTTRGIYMDSTGQLAIGDSNNYMKFFEDTDGSYKLIISANSIRMGTTGQTVEEAIKDVTDKVDAIESPIVGGRNLLLDSKNVILERSDYDNTTREKGKITVTKSGIWNAYHFISGYPVGHNELSKPMTEINPIGTQISFSIDIRTSNLTDDSVEIAFDMRVSSNAQNRDDAVIKIKGNQNGKWIRYYGTIKSTMDNTNQFVVNIRNLISSKDHTGVIIEYRNPMVEMGNVGSDWVEAPEDVDNNAEKKSIKQSLNIIKGDAEEVQRQYDVIYKNSNLIGTAKTELLNSKTSYNSAYSSLISFINTALNAGIVTTAMINSIDSAFGTYRSALGVFNKKLQEAIDSINSNKIDNIKIGGENLIFREKYWQTTTPTVVQLTAEPEHSRIRIKKVTADTAKHIYLNFVKPLTKGKTYTLSYDIYTDMPITSEQLLFLRYNRSGQALQYMKDQTVSSINTWIHKELTFVCNHSGTDDISIDSLAFSTTHFNEGQTILFRNVKLEEGNKATTYSYAPEDERLESSRAGVNMLPNTKSLIVTGLTGVNYKYERRDIVTAINLKPFTIYTVSFKCKVLSGSTTKCSVGVTNSKIATVYQRGDLTITDDRMSWSFYTRNATDCSTLLFYAGQAGQTGTNKVEYSEIMLEETSIASEKWIPNAGDVDYVIESKKVAINNLILNTKNMKDTSGWIGNINIGQSEKINEPTFYNRSSTTSEVVAGTSRFRVKPNTKYCFSMILYINKNCKSVDVWWIAKFKDSTNSFDNTIQFIKEWQEVKGKYTRVVGTFTTGPNDYDGYIRIDNNGKTDDATDDSIIYWTEAMVAEGDVFSGYSPSIEDMNLRVTKAESDLTVVNNAISAKVWGEDINVALGRQADNLVRNGNGGTKDNSNFRKSTFVGNIRGSKYYPSFLKDVSPIFAPNDDRIYIDKSKDYILSYEIRAKLADSTNKTYFAIECYDIDGYGISPTNYKFISKTTTKLKKALNKGDTTIEVESLSNWLTASSVPDYQRSVIFWNYKDSTGYQYPKETYSRNSQERFGRGLWDSISDEDKVSGVIRLKNPWNGGTYPIGTELSQGNSGTTHMYVGADGLVNFNDKWYSYNVAVTGSSFRPGTAFVKMGVYGKQSVYLSNLYFGIDRATSGQLNDLSNTVTNVQKTVSQHTIDLSGITSKVEKIESSDFQVHNLQRHSGGKYKNAGIEAWNMSGKDTLSWFTNYGSPGTFADYYDLYKGGSSGGIYAYSQSPIHVTAGEKYTVSFNYGRSAVGGATHRFVIQCSNTYPFGAVTKNVVDRYMPSNKANEIIRQEFQFTIPADTKSIKVALVNSVNGAGQSCSFYIDKIMINKGLVAYDWSPHEYDIESQFKSVEQKITAESILTTISSGINGNKGSINTMQFLLDKDGATIKNGALTILNNAGAQVLKGDADGNLMFSGYLSIIDQTSKKVISKLWGKQFAVEGAYRSATVLEADSDVRISCLDRDKDIFGQVENEVLYRTKMPYFDPSDWSTILRWDECVYLTSQETLSIQAGSSSLNKDYNNPTGQLTLMVWYPIKDDGSGATVSQTYLELLPGKIQTNKPFYPYPSIKMEESVPIHFFNSDPAKNKSGNRIDRIGVDFEILSQQGYVPNGGTYLRLGSVSEDQKNREWHVSIDAGTTYIHNSLVVKGTKNRIVETVHYGNVAMNAYETSDALFGDVGEATIGEDGLAYIMFDEQFLETVNTKFGYNVFLQKYCKNDVWIKERTLTYFVVEGEPGTEFGWHVMAKQKGYEADRMESFEVPDSQPVFDMTDEEIFGEKDQMAENGYKYIEDFEKEMY